MSKANYTEAEVESLLDKERSEFRERERRAFEAGRSRYVHAPGTMLELTDWQYKTWADYEASLSDETSSRTLGEKLKSEKLVEPQYLDDGLGKHLYNAIVLLVSDGECETRADVLCVQNRRNLIRDALSAWQREHDRLMIAHIQTLIDRERRNWVQNLERVENNHACLDRLYWRHVHYVHGEKKETGQ